MAGQACEHRLEHLHDCIGSSVGGHNHVSLPALNDRLAHNDRGGHDGDETVNVDPDIDLHGIAFLENIGTFRSELRREEAAG